MAALDCCDRSPSIAQDRNRDDYSTSLLLCGDHGSAYRERSSSHHERDLARRNFLRPKSVPSKQSRCGSLSHPAVGFKRTVYQRLPTLVCGRRYHCVVCRVRFYSFPAGGGSRRVFTTSTAESRSPRIHEHR